MGYGGRGKALDCDRMFKQLTIAYHPIVDLRTLEIVGYEALARHPGTTPFQLFLNAERGGYADALDLAAISRACEAAADWLPSGCRLFLNVTPATVRAAASGRIQGIDTGKIPRARVVWELSERRGWPSDPAAIERVKAVLTGELALDDVGDGHAELTRPFRLHPTWLKASASLIQGCGTDPLHRPALLALVQMAGMIGAKVVAEGIEMVEDMEECRRCGIGYGQGFLFAEPSPVPPLEINAKEWTAHAYRH